VALSTPAPLVTDDLRLLALQGDWAQWASAWQRVEQGACSQLLAELQADRPASLVLCSERHGLFFEKRSAGWGVPLKLMDLDEGKIQLTSSTGFFAFARNTHQNTPAACACSSAW